MVDLAGCRHLDLRWFSVGLGDTRVTPKEPIADRFVGEAVLTILGR